MSDDTQDARLHLVMPAKMKEQIERATAQEGAERGRPMSVSEWVRNAIREALRED